MVPLQPWAHWENVVSLADQCLYRVKQATRNGWIGAVPLTDDGLLSWNLDHAVAREEVRLVQSAGLLQPLSDELQPG